MTEVSAMNAVGLRVARITLEAASPLAVGSGQLISVRRRNRAGDTPNEEVTIHAAALVRDANNLPTIPGASWQGVMRRLFAEEWSERESIELFGIEAGVETGRSGRLSCGFGIAHDQRDRAVSGRISGVENGMRDPVIELLSHDAPIWRDHVALNARHAPDGARKFAVAAVPIGTRFSIEMSAWGGEDVDAWLKKVLLLFAHPRFRLGRATHRGYGRVRVVRASQCAPVMHNAEKLRELLREPPSTLLPQNLDMGLPLDRLATVARLSLTFPEFFRIGGLTDHCSSLTEGTVGARNLQTGAGTKNERMSEREAADNVLLLLREPQITYANGVGTVDLGNKPGQYRFPVPGSSIKGVLAHRMQFYANKLSERTIDVEEWLKLSAAERDDRLKTLKQPMESIVAFLGTGKGPRGADGVPDKGASARWYVDDTIADDAEWVVAVDHASLDRFTGGVRDGALFAEEVLLGAKVEVTVTLLPSRTKATDGKTVGDWPERTAKAFLLALRDLCKGRLAVGGRSNGVGAGKVSWGGKHADEWQALADACKVPRQGASL